VNPFSIFRPHHQWRIGRALFQHENVSVGVVPNAWTDVRWLGGLCAPEFDGETDSGARGITTDDQDAW
jgi:hypothetical protein